MLRQRRMWSLLTFAGCLLFPVKSKAAPSKAGALSASMARGGSELRSEPIAPQMIEPGQTKAQIIDGDRDALLGDFIDRGIDLGSIEQPPSLRKIGSVNVGDGFPTVTLEEPTFDAAVRRVVASVVSGSGSPDGTYGQRSVPLGNRRHELIDGHAPAGIIVEPVHGPAATLAQDIVERFKDNPAEMERALALLYDRSLRKTHDADATLIALEAWEVAGLQRHFDTTFQLGIDWKPPRSPVTPGAVRKVEELQAIANQANAQFAVRQRQFFEELQRQNKETSKAVEVLAAGIAHDAKNLLTAIIPNLELIETSLGKFGQPAEGTTKHVQTVLRAANRLETLMKNFIRFLRNTDELDLAKYDTAEIWHLFRGALKPMAEEKSIRLELDAPESAIFTTDRRRFESIFLNLLTNALKYTSPGGQVWIRIKPTDTTMELTIEDTGIGISEKLQGRIFEPYYRTPNGEEKAEGTGLGLAQLQHDVLKLGGTVTVTSEVGKGSIFTVHLPTIPE